MPYEWVDPELFLEHEGVAVYHCYDDDNMVSTYWYTTEITDCNVDTPELEGFQFDVRELPHLGLDANDPKNHPAIIQNAIREGLITGEPASKTDPPPLVVKIEVMGGVASVVEQPPGIEVEIIDYDLDEGDEADE
jgi:hypothetical protein